MSIEDRLEQRLSRIETRVVSGFTQLGVNPCTRSDESSDVIVDKVRAIAYIGSPQVTIGTVIRLLEASGVPPDKASIVYQGDPMYNGTPVPLTMRRQDE